MDKNQNKGHWLTTKQAQKHLKVSGCELMHKREHGELVFEKRGRAYFYYFEQVDESILS
ncbi:helix-turn-helix domain-containing protein [Pseudoalteromonas luteoviolacea]|uniref:helix-turn-helix domain-containing protein n=1 Tax=Pseudoalteromonas luteoviolacea TaxID=43657 RepID=UPI000B19FA3A|nr:helix-turn-helix domain-containing protein [Pseudoalteromonas luteoviolacea]